MRPAIRYYVFNSFTKVPFAGNPAGVVLDSAGLDDTQMQAIARQLNLVETVFAFPDPAPGIPWSLRYFTPLKELPITGHPTIAAWACLLHTGRVKFDDRTEATFLQQTKAGTIKIGVRGSKIYASQKEPVIRELPGFDWLKAYRIFGMHREDVEESLMPAAVDAGLGHLIFGVRSLAVLMNLHFRPEDLAELCEQVGVRECQIFCRETISPEMDGHTRNLCPRHGLEDPACGNGNAALGAYFARYVTHGEQSAHLFFEQGHIVNQPAVIEVLIEDGMTMIGGQAVFMQEGTIHL